MWRRSDSGPLVVTTHTTAVGVGEQRLTTPVTARQRTRDARAECSMMAATRAAQSHQPPPATKANLFPGSFSTALCLEQQNRRSRGGQT